MLHYPMETMISFNSQRDEISSERESQLKKSDFNATIYNIKDNYAKGAIYTTTYTVRINNLPKDHPNDRFEVFVD